MRRRWLAIAVILTVPSGCDNVTWGGVDVHMQSPSQDADSAAASTAAADSTGTEERLTPPVGPILLAGVRDGDSATLAVAGFVQGDGLQAFSADDSMPDRRTDFVRHMLAPDSQLVLFAEGVRVGRLTVARTGVDDSFCVPRPTVTGVIELVPAAAGASRLLAFPDSSGSTRPYGAYEALEDRYPQRVASLNLAMEAIPNVGATWPPSLLDTRADIRVFQLPGSEGVSVAATFLYHDRLTMAAPGPNAYALFVMGSERQGEYRSDFVWYQKASDDGKGAARYFDHLDLNGDGRDEVILDVLGNGRRWFATLGWRNGSWTRTFQDPCGSSVPNTGN